MEWSILQLRRKWDLLRALWSDRPGLTKPLFLSLEMTSRCNLTCVGCRHHSQWLQDGIKPKSDMSDMSLDVAEQIASKFQDLSGIMLYLEGTGEPFIHPQVMDIIRCLKRAGFDLTIFTNGTLLDARLVAEVIEARVNMVRFSVWAGDEATFERNYPGSNKKHFRRITESLEHFQRLRRQTGSVRPKVNIFFVVNKLNKDEIPSVVELADRYRCDGITFGRFISFGAKTDAIRFNRPERAGLIEELKQYKTILKKKSLSHNLARDLEQLAAGPETWYYSPCLVCWFHLHILVNGDVVPCCRSTYMLGNIAKQSLAEIWDGPAINEFRRRAAAPDGHEWLKAQGTDCTDCPHIIQMRKLHQWMRIIDGVRWRCQ